MSVARASELAYQKEEFVSILRPVPERSLSSGRPVISL